MQPSSTDPSSGKWSLPSLPHLVQPNFPEAEISEPNGKRKVPEYLAAHLLFSICIRENANPNDLSLEVFTDWLRDLPIAAESVRVESVFK